VVCVREGEVAKVFELWGDSGILGSGSIGGWKGSLGRKVSSAQELT
jgi:hypothetical protein